MDERPIEQQEAPGASPAPPAPVAEDGGDGDGVAQAVAVEPELAAAELRERAGKADEYLALAQRTQADFENYR